MTPAHVLLVEDSTLVADALRVVFEANGFRVTIAGGVGPAVKQVMKERPDVMLLDLTLPDGDGLSVLERLGESGEAGPPVTLALTGYDDDATRERCLAAGCHSVLLKPVAIQHLLETVRSAMQSATEQSRGTDRH